MSKRLKIRIMLLTPLLLALFFSFIPQTNANVAPCDTYQVNGGDQAFLMNLNTPLKWGDTVYTNNIYVSPKGTITFGVGDFTYWTYPSAPSISIGSYDYHAFPNQETPGVWSPGWGYGNNLYVRYGSTATSICVDWKVMLWGQSSGEPIYIRMLAEVNPVNYTWTPTYQVSSNAPSDARYGARYIQNGPVQPLSIQVISTPPPASPTPSPTIIPTQTPTLIPTPTPTSTPTVIPTESPTANPTPSETVTPSPTPTQSPDPIQPDPDPTPVVTQTSEPIIEPAPESTREPEQTLEPSSELTPSKEIISITEQVDNAINEVLKEEITNEQLDNIAELLLKNYKVNETMPVAELLSKLNTEQILELLEQLDPNQIIEYRDGVTLEAGVAIVFEQLADPAALVGELFSNPGQTLEALGQLGADMTEEERETSQDVVVAAVVASQVATMAAVAAIPPSAPSAPSAPSGPSGPGSQPKNEFDAGSGGEAKRKPKVKPKKKVKVKRKIKVKPKPKNNRRIK